MHRMWHCLAVLLLPAVADAASTGDYVTIPATDCTLGWSADVPLLQADPSAFPGQSLQSVRLILRGEVSGLAKVENQAAGPATLSTSLAAMLSLKRPDSSSVGSVSPGDSVVELVSAFDNVTDYGGASGRTYSALADSVETSFVLTSPDDLALFSGTQTVTLGLLAEPESAVAGSAQLASALTTMVGATVTVEYTYGVPEPSTLGLLAGALLLLSRRRATGGRGLVGRV